MELKKIFKILIITCFIVILIDQVSKILIDNLVKNDIVVIEEVLTITKSHNQKASSVLVKQNLGNIGLCLVIIIIIFNYIISQKDKMKKSIIIFLSFILAGGVSNLIDRIFRSTVFDFIKIENFPVFNIADIFIVIGWLLFVISFLKETAIDLKAAIPVKDDNHKKGKK